MKDSKEFSGFVAGACFALIGLTAILSWIWKLIF